MLKLADLPLQIQIIKKINSTEGSRFDLSCNFQIESVMFMGRSKLYEAAAEKLLKEIQEGRFLPGERLPSVRELSKRLQRSIATVQKMFELLERRGWVEARPRSGYFVKAQLPDQDEPPRLPRTRLVPGSVFQWRLALNSTSHDPGDLPHLFGRAMPDLTLTSINPMKRYLADMTRAASTAALGYGALQGVEQLRVQIARRMVEAGCRILPEDILITSGCQEALLCALQAVTEPGDIIAIETPTYYGIIQILEALKLKALEIPCDPVQGMSLGAMELALEQWPVKACVVTPNFGNPLGCFMPKANKEQLVCLANKYDIVVIEDDIYSDLDYRPGRPKAIKAFDTEDRVIMVSSFSKVIAPGLSVGWMIPGRHFEAVEQQKYITSLTTPVLPQLALARFLENGDYDRHLRRIKPLYQQRRDRVRELVRESFPEGTRSTCPKGGLLLWIELPEEVDAYQLSQKALLSGISIAPGPMFSTSGKYSNFIRLSFATVNTKDSCDAVKKLGELVAAFMRDV
ncbi:GntR family transcriptional regulator [Endozoicomonas sp. OPT23]|uniref:aminotransferase-like domain-containing protein n=1 Tax=Endozoicomonas sp. OPT23 TaxID=2072845 RepID=UPI00129AA0CA|nr:PLP-dependent aminotransferase family protein [Endozoicomonas sp. OPT23]MRI35262.1 GntR family transcriptional regulator [Endozoicomonas sp. OPT23]